MFLPIVGNGAVSSARQLTLHKNRDRPWPRINRLRCAFVLTSYFITQSLYVLISNVNEKIKFFIFSSLFRNKYTFFKLYSLDLFYSLNNAPPPPLQHLDLYIASTACSLDQQRCSAVYVSPIISSVSNFWQTYLTINFYDCICTTSYRIRTTTLLNNLKKKEVWEAGVKYKIMGAISSLINKQQDPLAPSLVVTLYRRSVMNFYAGYGHYTNYYTGL